MGNWKEKWKVSWFQFWLIIITFALGGSLCGYAGRKLLNLSGMEKGFLYYIIYLILITLLWPLCVLMVSVPFGQFVFFKNYLHRIFRKIGNKK